MSEEQVQPEAKVGRPVVYTDEFVKELAVEFLKYMEDPEHIWFKGFANLKGFSPQRLSEFAEQSTEFSEALEKARGIQEERLVIGGLKGAYNSTITGLVLKNSHDWKEKQEVDANVKGTFSLTDLHNASQSK